MLDFFRLGLSWLAGALAGLILLSCALFIVWALVLLYARLRGDSDLVVAPEPPVPALSGYTLTLLDAFGHDLSSGPVDVNRRFRAPVKRFGIAARFALVRAGVVVREGAVVQFGPKHDEADLEVTSLEWAPDHDLQLHLPAAWLQ